MSKSYSICHSCGKKLEYTDCSNRRTRPNDPQCEVLKGWLEVRQWKGFGSFDGYDFCSFICLQRWVDNEVPKIPEVFLESLGEGKSEQEGGVKMAVPMCQVCGTCPECKKEEDYKNVTLPCIDRIVTICKCCIEAIKRS